MPLFTSDGTNKQMLTGGTVPEIFKTANFGSRAEEQFAALREYQPDGPLMCTEFWNGWFDHWTEEHHHRPRSRRECVGIYVPRRYEFRLHERRKLL